jgi:pimeloyl-ACP methyl ester carboxylesterase
MSDGRAIGLCEHGDPQGKPLLWFPGTPSSRLWPVPDAEAARAAGVRVVVIERPGFGVSDFQPNRCVLDWPRDVVQVADALGLDSFAVAGSSGAGPYVGACAYALPDRVRVAGMVGVVAPLDALAEHFLVALGELRVKVIAHLELIKMSDPKVQIANIVPPAAAE